MCTNIAGSSICTSCDAGKFSAAVGATSVDTCSNCNAGKFSAAVGATSVDTCFNCNAGKFSAAVGATVASTCARCAAGKFSVVIGAYNEEVCLYCPQATHSETEASACSEAATTPTCMSGVGVHTTQTSITHHTDIHTDIRTDILTWRKWDMMRVDGAWKPAEAVRDPRGPIWPNATSLQGFLPEL